MQGKTVPLVKVKERHSPQSAQLVFQAILDPALPPNDGVLSKI